MGTYKVAIEYDDLSPSHPIGPQMWDILQDFREHYPGYKVTMFTIPWEIRHGSSKSIAHSEWKPWVKAARKAYDEGWMRFAMHGLTHMPMEFEKMGYEQAEKRLKAGMQHMELADLPLLPIFKAPNWAISEPAKRAAEDLGLTVVEDGYYDWNLRDGRPQEKEYGDKIIIAHGHIQDGDGCFNGLKETRNNIYSLPEGTEFYFLDEAL